MFLRDPLFRPPPFSFCMQKGLKKMARLLNANYINGKFVNGDGPDLNVVDPTTGKSSHVLSTASIAQVDLAVQAARKAQAVRPRTTGKERAVWLRAIAEGIKERKSELAVIEAQNSGKPLPEAEMDMDDSVTTFEYYATLAEKLDSRQWTPVEIPTTQFTTHLVYEPLGVVGLIIPWNYPLMMAAWKVAPAIAAGCSMVLKPSEVTPITAIDLAKIIEKAGVPSGLFNLVQGAGPVGAAIAAHPDIDGVAFTGSGPTGKRIMAEGSNRVKKISLELGGKSPIIVFDDVDLEKAVEWTMFGFMFTNGQICSATSRLLVQENIAPKFLSLLKEQIEKVKVGPPLEEGVKIGPLVNAPQYAKVMGYINQAKANGTTLLTGGGRPAHLGEAGFYVQPTVFTNVGKETPLWREEVFGPVLAVRTFKTEAEAIAEANDSEFGLGGAVISNDTERCKRVAREVNSGILWINCSQPCFCHAPWGGFKQSSLGRDLGQYGLDKFLEVKQITTNATGETFNWYSPAKL